MKGMLAMLAIGLVCGTVRAAPASPEATPGAANDDPVKVIPVDDGKGAVVAVDVLKKQSETTSWLSRNWGKVLTAGAAALAYERVANNNDLWPYSGRKSEDRNQKSGEPIAPAPANNSSGRDSATVTVSGNTAPVSVNVNIGTTSE